MWGVCLDSNAIQDGLFQTVIQYKRKENGEVVIISPKTTYKLDIKHVKELSAPPQYIYGSHEQNPKRVVIAMVSGHG